MVRMMASTALHLLANAVGLLLARIFLTGFTFDIPSFVIAVILFSAIGVVTGPLLLKLSMKNVPALQGGVALVTTFVALWLTNLILPGFDVGGVKNLLLGTFIVWLGALIAGVFLPMFLFKKYLEEKRSN